MESANIHHQLQDPLAGSSLPTQSCYGVSSSHAWTPTQNPNATLNAGNFNPNYNGFILNSRQNQASMIQESGFQWTNNAGQSAHDDTHFSKIKEELAESFPRFTDVLNSPSSIEDSQELPPSYLKNGQKGLNYLSSEEFYSNSQNVSSFGNALSSRGNFSQIYPSINISNLNQSSSATLSSFEMNLQALDLLATSSRFCGNFSQTPHYYNNNNDLGTYRESPPFGRLDDHKQQSRRRPSSSPTKLSSFTKDMREAKRSSSSSSIGPKATESAPKKPRLESRTSCPPFKVRKEKLGDRIAALQQLVAPFGKTDTASVLMEAIGYIKFLQNQVETLSAPYMKSSRNKTCRTTQGGSKVEDVNKEPNRGLRSQGLCLVPLPCMSYVINIDRDGGGGGIWPPLPNFGEWT